LLPVAGLENLTENEISTQNLIELKSGNF